MKTRYGTAVGIAVLASFGLGTASIGRLYAQTKAPAYVVIDISETMDVDAYIKAVSAAEPRANGAPPNRFVVIAFDDAEQAKAWYSSPAIKEVNATRLNVTKSRAFMVEGLVK